MEKIRLEGFTLQFNNRLQQDSFNLEPLVAQVSRFRSLSGERSPDKRNKGLLEVVRRATGYSRDEIKDGFSNDSRDVVGPKVAQAIGDILQPWILARTTAELPTIDIQKVRRMTGLSESDIKNSLCSFPLSFSINGTTVTTGDISYRRKSPKRITAASRYQSREPGKKVVVKSGFQTKRFREQPQLIGEINLQPQLDIKQQTAADDSQSSDLSLAEKDWNLLLSLEVNPDEIPAIMSAFLKLEGMEFGGKAFSPRRAFLERLAELNARRELPVVIFNCFNFDWMPQGRAYPKCYVLPDIPAAISAYYQDKVDEINKLLSGIGQPRFSIIVPDSEIFDSRLWNFEQSLNAREDIVRTVMADLAQRLIKIKAPNLDVVTWSDFCQVQGLSCPSSYTTRAYEQIISDPKLLRRVVGSLDEERKYLENYLRREDVSKIDYDDLFDRNIWYAAMYFGEGMALLDSRSLLINFEEGRVAKWMKLGSSNELPVSTPIDDVEEYYLWKNQQIRLRKGVFTN